MVVLDGGRSSKGFTLIEGTAAWAEPGGLLQLEAYEDLRDEILDQLRAALPVDGVILGLHGAMVAQGYDDCEGDLLERVRAIVGPKVVVAAELDPHSHLTRKRVANANILAAFLEFPHTDFLERAEHLVDLALRAVRGEIRPAMAAFECRMIDIFPTSREPMRGFVDRLRAKQGEDGVLSLSLIHGFMAADVPEMGTQMLAIVDGDGEKAAALAEEAGAGNLRPARAHRDAYARNRRRSRRRSRPGRSKDRQAGRRGRCVGQSRRRRRRRRYADPAPDARARDRQFRGGDDLGPDRRDLLSGGWRRGEAAIAVRRQGRSQRRRADRRDGRSVRAAPESWQSFGASRVTLGPSALVRLAGTDIQVILNTNRTQTFEPDVFSNLGLDPASKDLLLIKSTNHFYAGFAPIARRDRLYRRGRALSLASEADAIQEARARDLAPSGEPARAVRGSRRRARLTCFEPMPEWRRCGKPHFPRSRRQPSREPSIFRPETAAAKILVCATA